MCSQYLKHYKHFTGFTSEIQFAKMLDVNDRECQYIFNEATEVFADGGEHMETHLYNNNDQHQDQYENSDIAYDNNMDLVPKEIDRMTNSMPSIELDSNPQFGSFTQGFQPLYTDNDIVSSINNESSNPKIVEFDLNFEPAKQRLDLVNEFDLEMNNNIKWLFKKDNIKVVQNKLQKNKKDRKKKKVN